MAKKPATGSVRMARKPTRSSELAKSGASLPWARDAQHFGDQRQQHPGDRQARRDISRLGRGLALQAEQNLGVLEAVVIGDGPVWAASLSAVRSRSARCGLSRSCGRGVRSSASSRLNTESFRASSTAEKASAAGHSRNSVSWPYSFTTLASAGCEQAEHGSHDGQRPVSGPVSISVQFDAKAGCSGHAARYRP